MKKINYLIYCISLVSLVGCSLNEEPVTQLSKNAIFNSESGMKTYMYSMYDGLPTANAIQQSEASLSDYFAYTSPSSFVLKGAYNESNDTGWDWSVLRNINSFIVNCQASSVASSVKNNYLGMARF